MLEPDRFVVIASLANMLTVQLSYLCSGLGKAYRKKCFSQAQLHQSHRWPSITGISLGPSSHAGAEHRIYITNQYPRSFVLLPQIEEPDCTAGLVRRLTLTTKTFKALANQANSEPAFNGEAMDSNCPVAKVFVVREVKDSG